VFGDGRFDIDARVRDALEQVGERERLGRERKARGGRAG
jgi:hypothetical protein